MRGNQGKIITEESERILNKMKIGVYLGNIKPQAGGGFTFEDSIFRELVELGSESKHSFVILTRGELPRFVTGSPKNFQFINLSYIQRKQFGRRVRIKLAQSYNRLAKSIPEMPKLQSGRLRWIEEILSDIGLDIVWNVTPVGGIYPTNIPFIFTVWDLGHRLQPCFPEISSRGRWEDREKQFNYLRKASFIITGTEVGKSNIIDLYQIPAERIKIIPFPTPGFALSTRPLNSKETNKKVLDKYNIPSGYLFYPAQFWAHKNHVNLLLAIRFLRDAYGLVLPVVFVGSDKGNEQYAKQVVEQLDLKNQVHFLGFVSQEELVSLYHNAFALTCVTFMGPDNLPPLEAFALGCPVIASNVSGAQEQLGDAALLVDPKDEKQIAEAIKALLDDQALREKLVARGIARASKWTAQDFVKSVFSLFDEFEPIRRCWA